MSSARRRASIRRYERPTTSRRSREAVYDGTIDAFASDHAPHTESEKRDGPAPGFSGLEVAVGAYAAALPDLPLPRFVELLSTNPARILALPGGTLGVGAPADVTIFADRQWTVDPTSFASKGKCTPVCRPAFTAPRGRDHRRRRAALRRAGVCDVSSALPAALFLADGSRFDGHGLTVEGTRAGRGGLLHRNDGIRRGAHRSVVRRADSYFYLPDDRQLRHLRGGRAVPARLRRGDRHQADRLSPLALSR